MSGVAAEQRPREVREPGLREQRVRGPGDLRAASGPRAGAWQRGFCDCPRVREGARRCDHREPRSPRPPRPGKSPPFYSLEGLRTGASAPDLGPSFWLLRCEQPWGDSSGGGETSDACNDLGKAGDWTGWQQRAHCRSAGTECVRRAQICPSPSTHFSQRIFIL